MLVRAIAADTGAQARNDLKVGRLRSLPPVAVSGFRPRRQRQPHVSGPPAQTAKSTRRDRDDAIGVEPEAERLAEAVIRRAALLLPERIAADGHVFTCCVRRVRPGAGRRLETEYSKVAGAVRDDLEATRPLAAPQGQGLAQIGGARFELVVQRGQRLERRVAGAIPVRVAHSQVDTRDTIWIRHLLRRAQQNTIEDVHHDDGGSDPERQYQHRAGREEWGCRESPHGLSNVRGNQSHHRWPNRKLIGSPSSIASGASRAKTDPATPA